MNPSYDTSNPRPKYPKVPLIGPLGGPWSRYEVFAVAGWEVGSVSTFRNLVTRLLRGGRKQGPAEGGRGEVNLPPRHTLNTPTEGRRIKSSTSCLQCSRPRHLANEPHHVEAQSQNVEAQPQTYEAWFQKLEAQP